MNRPSGIDPFLLHVPDPEPAGERTLSRGETPASDELEGIRPVERDEDGGEDGDGDGARDGGRGADDSSETTLRGRALESVGAVASARRRWWPALVRLPTQDFELPQIPEFVKGVRLDNVLSGRGSKRALMRIGEQPGVVVEVSREGGTWELDQSVPTVKGNPVEAPEGAVPEDGCLIGIIDGGLDPLHDAFLGADGRTRLLYVWDQTATEGPTPNQVNGTLEADYGVLYTAEDIDAALAGRRALPPMSATDDGRLHGTHVASIAAGRSAPAAQEAHRFAGGMAPDAPIIFVVPALRSSGQGRPSEGFAKSHVDALKLIDSIAHASRQPVVVNVSAGIAAGAHDGNSLLEAGFDAFTKGGHAPGRAIVKSAGNARDSARFRRFNVAQGATVLVKLGPPVTRDRAPTLVEVWFSSAHQLELKLSETARAQSIILSTASPVLELQTELGTARASYERFHRDNGDSLLLLSLPPTNAGFTLELSGVATRGAGETDLWIEGPLTIIKGATVDRTLTMPGTARSVITVASGDRTGQAIAESSSLGPTRDERKKPELFAPGLQIRAAKAGTRSDTVVLSGTSMAAPHVTGALARLFSKQARLGRDWPNALQARAALIATAAQMVGVWQADRGFGLLDAAALLCAFDPPASTPSSSDDPAGADPRT